MSIYLIIAIVTDIVMLLTLWKKQWWLSAAACFLAVGLFIHYVRIDNALWIAWLFIAATQGLVAYVRRFVLSH